MLIHFKLLQLWRLNPKSYLQLLQLGYLRPTGPQRAVLIVPLPTPPRQDAPQPHRLSRRHAVRARRAVHPGRATGRALPGKPEGAERGGRPLGRRLLQAAGAAAEAGEQAEAAVATKVHDEGVRQRPAYAEEGDEQLRTGARHVCQDNH